MQAYCRHQSDPQPGPLTHPALCMQAHSAISSSTCPLTFSSISGSSTCFLTCPTLYTQAYRAIGSSTCPLTRPALCSQACSSSGSSANASARFGHTGADAHRLAQPCSSSCSS